MEEVAQHSKKDDCWMVIDGKVYDISSWAANHPGGEIIFSYAGMDATDVFDAFHDENQAKLLPGFYIGEAKNPKITSASQEHRALRKSLEERGMYNASMLFYAYKFLFNVAILSTSVALVLFTEQYWLHMLAAVVLAVFWQQCGWLSHDFIHHQVFKDRRYNNYAGYLIGNLFQGFSVSWWKAKHNLHHAVPNVAGFDPDIDTMPFLAWSEKLIDGELVGIPQVLIQYQYLFYLPLICLARFSWVMQSLIYAKTKCRRNRSLELTSLFFHYIWYFGLVLSCSTWEESLSFLVLSQASAGMLLALAFSLNHNGMTILASGSQSTVDFTTMQVLTGRDVHAGPFGIVHWFMGGLDMQIEHHLFPRIPRHNLRQLQSKVRPLCKKHSIDYHQTTWWQGTKELFTRLYSVGLFVTKTAELHQ